MAKLSHTEQSLVRERWQKAGVDARKGGPTAKCRERGEGKEATRGLRKGAVTPATPRSTNSTATAPGELHRLALER